MFRKDDQYPKNKNLEMKTKFINIFDLNSLIQNNLEQIKIDSKNDLLKFK